MELQNLEQCLRMTITGKSNGLLCWGRGGTGKSYTLMKMIKEIGVSKNGYQYVSSSCSPRALFNSLEECEKTMENPKLLVLDDIDSSLNRGDFSTILRGATFPSKDNQRIVSYFTAKETKQFAFSGRIVILANSIPKNDTFKPLMDRLMCYNHNPSNEEILDVVEKKIINEKTEVALADKKKITQFIKTNCGGAKLSFRLFLKAFDYYSFNKNTWESFVLKEIKNLI